MNEFMIRFASAENALSRMQQAESEIRSNGEDISKIRNGFHAEFGGKTRILRNLRGQIEKMSDLGDSLKTFESSLESILSLYNAVELNLLKQVQELPGKSMAGTGSSATAEQETGTDETVDRIHRAGKTDIRGGLVAGASMIGAATLGSSVSGVLGAAASDFDEIESLFEQMPRLIFPEYAGETLWEDFLSFLPLEAVGELPEPALEYLHELFDILRVFPLPFGAVFFPGPADLINCGIWTTFYTLITWYFYQQGFFQKEETEPLGSEAGTSDAGEEPGDSGEESASLGEYQEAGSETGRSTEDGRVKLFGEKNAAAAAQDAADPEPGKSGSGSSGHGGGSGSHSGGSGGGSSYAGEPAVDIPEAESSAKEYVSGLVGETGKAVDGASDWSIGAMKNWGEKAAEQAARNGAGDLTAAAASGSGTGAIGRTARSVLCAAVINAGIELVMHGAGAAGSILRGGKEDLFTEADLDELQQA